MDFTASAKALGALRPQVGSTGSLLASRGIDLVTIRAAMGHAALSTTSRYLHARPAAERAQAFTAAFATAVEEVAA